MYRDCLGSVVAMCDQMKISVTQLQQLGDFFKLTRLNPVAGLADFKNGKCAISLEYSKNRFSVLMPTNR